MVSMELGWGSFKSIEILWPFSCLSLSLNVSFPLVSRESVKLLKVDDLWAVDNDVGDVEKSVDESGNYFAIIERTFIYLHKN